MHSENQKRYITSYNKENYKMYQFRVRTDDTKTIDFLNNVNSRNNYIISLIKDDINCSVLTIKQIKQIIKPILKQYGIEEVYLFGSYARGEATSKSDVDIYCERGNIKTFIDQGFLEDELKKSLGKEVDLIFIGAKMTTIFKDQLMEDLVKLC